MNIIYRRLPEVLVRYPVSRSTIYEWIRTGHFPKPVKLGRRVVAWTNSSLIAFDAARADRGADDVVHT
jgi:prophage regulatory protein